MSHPFGFRPVRVVICGDREWTDEGTIGAFISSLPTGSVVIHGACRGADTIAGQIAHELGYEVESYPARFDIYGLAAGPIRNRFMIQDGQPEVLVIFHDDLYNSKGSKDMLEAGKLADLTIIRFTSDSYVTQDNECDDC